MAYSLLLCSNPSVGIIDGLIVAFVGVANPAIKVGILAIGTSLIAHIFRCIAGCKFKTTLSGVANCKRKYPRRGLKSISLVTNLCMFSCEVSVR
jgi:hypothetical protein